MKKLATAAVAATMLVSAYIGGRLDNYDHNSLHMPASVSYNIRHGFKCWVEPDVYDTEGQWYCSK